MPSEITVADQRMRRELGDPFLAAAHPFYRPLLWTILACVMAFIAWACLAQLDEVTHGEGRVIPSSRMQKIQSLEGGILDTLLVKDGDVVEAGQPLLRLDPTHFRTSLDEARNHAQALEGTVARLQAEVQNHDTVAFPPDVTPGGAVARAELALFRARRHKLAESTAALQQQIDVAQKQIDIIHPLVAHKAVSEMEELKLREDISALEGRLSDLKTTYVQEANTDLASKKAELDTLQPIVAQRQDQWKRTAILSPVRGRVNNILITTRGGVIQPGEPIMEVTPLADRLLVEARIKPRDVAFLAPGMPAKVKITAYDYTVYGFMKGVVEQISADTIQEDTPHGKEPYYQVLIRTDSGSLNHNGKTLPIIPGMVAEVDIVSDKRSVASYILRPILKSRLY